MKLTEGRGTGIPKVIRAMRENGSPLPRFDTDENREYFTAILPLHPDAKELDLDGDLAGDLDGEPSKSPALKRKKLVLDFCKAPRSRAEIQDLIGLKNVQYFRVNFLSPLLKAGLLEMTIPQSPTSRLQKYRTTSVGLKYLASSDG